MKRICILIAVVALIIFSLSSDILVKITTISVFLFLLSIHLYIYLIRFRPGTGEKIDYISQNKKNDDIIREAKVIGKIPMSHYARIISKKSNPINNSTYTYKIEIWKFWEESQKPLSII